MPGSTVEKQDWSEGREGVKKINRDVVKGKKAVGLGAGVCVDSDVRCVDEETSRILVQ